MIGALVNQLAQTVVSGVASWVQSPAGQHFIHQGIHLAAHKACEDVWEHREEIAKATKRMLGMPERPSRCNTSPGLKISTGAHELKWYPYKGTFIKWDPYTGDLKKFNPSKGTFEKFSFDNPNVG